MHWRSGPAFNPAPTATIPRMIAKAQVPARLFRVRILANDGMWSGVAISRLPYFYSFPTVMQPAAREIFRAAASLLRFSPEDHAPWTIHYFSQVEAQSKAAFN
jgi:hypothetical protein